MAKVRWKILTLLLVMMVAVIGLVYSVSYLSPNARNVSIEEVVSNPQSFNGVLVKIGGYVVNVSYMFGPKYVLRNMDSGVEIALDGKGGPKEVDLEPYVSFIFDGTNYTQIGNMRVIIVGYVRYVGFVIDAPSYYIDVKRVVSELDSLEKIVIDFLKTTDVPNGVWNYAVEIKETYDHKIGGWVIVAKYTTMNAGHPGFFMEAIEHHTALITVSMKGEIMSAFCVWGSFHDDRIWDLLNQRWIQKDATKQ